jgi:hypothetical protein
VSASINRSGFRQFPVIPRAISVTEGNSARGSNRFTELSVLVRD